MLAYRLLTEDDTSAFCHKVTAALAAGWSLHGDPVYAFDAARGVMLARYVEARSPELDALLERAGVVRWFADHVDQATAIPDVSESARPVDNRPYATT